jgi:hypothetical protein
MVLVRCWSGKLQLGWKKRRINIDFDGYINGA